MDVDTLQETLVEGMRTYFNSAFRSVDMALDQMEKSWAMAREQDVKIHKLLEDLVTTWMSNLKSGWEELQRYLDKALTILEESAQDSEGLLPPLAWPFAPGEEPQADLLRTWIGFWGFSPRTTGGQGKQGEKPVKSAAKGE